MVKKTIAALVFGLFGLVLTAGCDGFGLGGGGAGGACGGAGGDGAVCEIVALSPCEQKCETEYNDAALTCGSISIEAERKTCQDKAHTAYKECRAACASCNDMYTTCQGKGSPCTKNIGGKTLCAYCLDNCLKREPYKFSQCYSCGFSDP